MSYEAVPRALSRLARTAKEVIPIRAEREASRARMGLEKARTEFEVGRAKKTEEHRERVWEAGKETRETGKIKAIRERETLARGEQPVTSADLFAGHRAEDIVHIYKDLLPAYKKGLGIEAHRDPDTDKLSYTKYGQPYKRWQLEQDAGSIMRITIQNTDPERLLETWADPTHKDHPWHEKAKKILRENDQEAIQRFGLKVLRRFQPPRGASPAEILQYNSQIKWIQSQIRQYQEAKTKKEVARIKAKEEIPTVGGVKIGTKEERKEGNQVVTYRMTKKGWKEIARGPRKVKELKEEKEPKASDFNSLTKLIERVTQKGEREPTPENVAMIDDAARAIGYEYKKIKGPIRPEEKRWWWFDPETKERWTLVKAESKKTTGQTPMGEKVRIKIPKGISKKEMEEEKMVTRGLKPTSPKKPITKQSTGWKKYLE